MDYTDKIISLLGQDTIIFKDSPEGQDILDCVLNMNIIDFQNKLREKWVTNVRHLYLYATGLYRICKCIAANSIVELGVREGNSSCTFLHAMEELNGKLFSFDPYQDVENNDMWKPEHKSMWNLYPVYDYIGYEKYSNEIKNFDLLYIDTDPHDFEQCHNQLRKWWVNNLREEGFIAVDDTAPQHQIETVGKRPSGLFNANMSFGALHAVLEFIDEYNDKIDFAFSINNCESNGTTLIKLK